MLVKMNQMQNVHVNTKFRQLFKKILEENYVITRYYSERLLKCLEDKSDNVGTSLIGTPIFSDIIFHAFQNLQSLAIPNKIFILEIVTILFRNELQFNKLQCQGFDFQPFQCCVGENVMSWRPSGDLHLACIKLVSALVTHCSGMKVLNLHKSWEKALHPGLHMRPARVSRAVYEFLSNLIWKCDEYEDEATLHEVLRAIMKPIHTSEYQTLKVFDAEKEKTYSDPVIAPLQALLAIMSETRRVTNSKCFVPILKECYFVEAPLHKLMVGTRDPNIICLYGQINFHFYLSVVSKSSIKAGRSESDFLNEIIACFVNSITKLMSEKQMVVPIMDVVLNINMFWAKTGSKLYSSTFERNGQKYEMEDQLLWLLMLPITAYVIKNVRDTSDVIEEYSTKMGQLITEHVTKFGYRYKAMLERGDLKKMTIQNVKLLFKMQGLLKAKQAGLLFQSLFHLLQIYIDMEGIGSCGVAVLNEDPLQTSDDVKLLSLVLAAIKMLLTEHTLNWYDNLEIICLQNGMMYLLRQQAMPTKQVLQILDLLELSIRRSLSPDMTLLVESKHGSALSEMTSIMKSLICHEDWEVRDSALSLLQACTDIAFVKYVPLQKLISENQLMIPAANAALTDSEYYVQATGLKCLAAATKIESMWRDVLKKNSNIYKQLTYLLRHNSEGIVRTEAANVLAEVYINKNTTKAFQNCMYRVMASAAIDDLHWEVQLAALRFWKQVIKNHLNDRGMMDGKFPKVTFSREKRKIIVLDEKEVKRQLSGVMNDLSANRCLTVLSQCMKEDYNIEVMKLAHCMSNKLIGILSSHNCDKVIDDQHVNSEMDHGHMETNMDVALDLRVVPYSSEKRDSIIEDILNTKTTELIMDLNHENEATKNVEQCTLPPLKEAIHPNKFLEDFKRTDYYKMIDNITNWKLEPQTLSELLDEILGDTNIEMSDYCIE